MRRALMVILINFYIVFARLFISARHLLFIEKSLGRTLPILEMYCVILKKASGNFGKNESDQLS